jgi:hypothetical protein
MLRFSRLVLAIPISVVVVTAGEAKVLRNNTNSPMVFVFKDAAALSRFNSLTNTGTDDESPLLPLLTCKTPQGSKIEVLGSGYRTAFVRVVEGSAAGCEGTVPLDAVSDQ